MTHAYKLKVTNRLGTFESCYMTVDYEDISKIVVDAMSDRVNYVAFDTATGDLFIPSELLKESIIEIVEQPEE